MADFDLGSILGSLSADDIESIKSIASSFIGNEVEEKRKIQPQQKGIPEIPDIAGLGMPDLSQLSALVPILQAFNKPDERLEFINALKPLLSQEKRQKADEAMKLVRLVSVLPLLRERGIM